MNALGMQLLAEFYDCDESIINNRVLVEQAMKTSVKKSGATMLQSVFHEFNPIGVSGVIVIAESHFSIHTWPEYGYCAVDIFTCGDKIDNGKAIESLKESLKAANVSCTEARRGVLNVPGLKHKIEVNQ